MELEIKPDRYVVHFPEIRATRESTREKRGQPGRKQRIGRETNGDLTSTVTLSGVSLTRGKVGLVANSG